MTMIYYSYFSYGIYRMFHMYPYVPSRIGSVFFRTFIPARSLLTPSPAAGWHPFWDGIGENGAMNSLKFMDKRGVICLCSGPRT